MGRALSPSRAAAAIAESIGGPVSRARRAAPSGLPTLRAGALFTSRIQRFAVDALLHFVHDRGRPAAAGHPQLAAGARLRGGGGYTLDPPIRSGAAGDARPGPGGP